MTIVRFAYPGAGPKDRAYSGALSPKVRRGIRRAGVATRGRIDGPLFGRSIYDQDKQAFDFEWDALSHEEARELFRQWEDASSGAAVLYYTPDDQSEPITMVSIGPPEILYQTAATASVQASAEEQR